MDMFIRLFNIATQEEVFINKSRIVWLTISEEDLIAGFTMDGTDETIFIQFVDHDSICHFMRGVQGEVYMTPKCTITAKEL